MRATRAYEQTAYLAEKFRLLKAEVLGAAEETAAVRAALGTAASPLPEPFPHLPYARTQVCPLCAAALVSVPLAKPSLAVCPECGYVGRHRRRA